MEENYKQECICFQIAVKWRGIIWMWKWRRISNTWKVENLKAIGGIQFYTYFPKAVVEVLVCKGGSDPIGG